MSAVFSVDLARAAANIGLCVLQSENGDVWRANFLPSSNWNLPTPLTPTTLADAIYDFCVREHIPTFPDFGHGTRLAASLNGEKKAFSFSPRWSEDEARTV